MSRIVIVGGGIGGLGAAGIFAKAGHDVVLLEKNPRVGGRANLLEAKGFTFDMGPSWYLMPDVFEAYFRLVGERVEDWLDLQRLSPNYRVFFKDAGDTVDISGDIATDAATFERIEPGASQKLRAYLDASKLQYDIALKRFLYKNYDSIFDFFTKEALVDGRKLSVFSRMDAYVSRFFKDERLKKIAEYTLVFLGSSPYDTPALYNIMSHVDFNLGVWYPMGGIVKVVDALAGIAQKNGAQIRTSSPVRRILVENGTAFGVELESGEILRADTVISNADLAHTDMDLIPAPYRERDASFWDKKTMAPSAFILYLGVDGKIPQLVHHNLLFAKDWRKGFDEIFGHAQWPSDPSLYVCAPSVTDPSVAPQGMENLFILVPIAPGLEDGEEQRAAYAEKILALVEAEMKIPDLRKRIRFQKIYAVSDFAKDYNSFKGTALGMAHTLRQTAFFRPNNVSRKVKNLLFVGAGTNPGIGMPVCLVSAELAYKRFIGDRSSGHLESLQTARKKAA